MAVGDSEIAGSRGLLSHYSATAALRQVRVRQISQWRTIRAQLAHHVIEGTSREHGNGPSNAEASASLAQVGTAWRRIYNPMAPCVPW